MSLCRDLFSRALAGVGVCLLSLAALGADYTVQITAEPAEYQIGNEPVYETLTKAEGSTCFFNAPDGMCAVTDGIRAFVAGYRIDRKSGESWILGDAVLGTREAFFEQPSADARVVWLWTNQVQVTVRTAISDEKVSLDGKSWSSSPVSAWYTIGEKVSVWGGQNTGRNYCWSHAPADSVYADEKCRAFTFAAREPLELISRARPAANTKTFLLEEGSNSWDNPEAWLPAGVPGQSDAVTLPPGSIVTVSNAINIASLELQGEESAETKLTFATKWATNRVAGAVTLGDYTTMTHEKNWHWYHPEGNNYYSIAVNVPDSADAGGYKKTPPEIWYTLNLQVGSNMTVAAGAKIDVTEAGYGPMWTPDGRDAGTVNTAKFTQGALPVHAGVSSCGWKTVGAVTKESQAFANCSEKVTYGSVRRPITPGSGNYYNTSFSSYKYGFGGGGIVHLMVAGELNLEGEILSRSGCQTSSQASGTGAGGSVWLEASAVTGSGTIDVRGGDFGGNKAYAPNSSSGRIAIYQTVAETNPASLTLKAGSAENNVDGSTVVNGANGSIYIENAADYPGRGEIIVDYGERACYNLTNETEYASTCTNVNCLLLTDGSLDGQYTFRKFIVRSHGIVTVPSGVSISTYALDESAIGRGVISANREGFGSIKVVTAPTSGKLQVTAEPSEYQIGSSPEYVASRTLTIGETAQYDAPSGKAEISEDKRAFIAGYRIDRKYNGIWVKGEPVYGSLSCTYRQLNEADARLVWLWKYEVRVSVSSEISSGKVSFDNLIWSSGSAAEWFTAGDPVRIWGYQFDTKSLVWTGAPDGATYPDRRYREINFAAPESPVELSVNERPVGKVIVTGDPADDYQIDGEPEYGTYFFEDGETGDFAAPSGYQQRSETNRARVIGYRFGAGELVNSLSYHHVQSGLSEDRLYWVWTNEYRVVINTTSEFASERYVKIGEGDWGFESAADWAAPGATVTLYGGKDDGRFYQWTGLPADATFDDAEKKRAATFKMPANPITIGVRMIPEPGVYVAGEPTGYQIDNEPKYGVTVVVDGETRDFAAPTDTLTLEEGVRTRVAGYRLETWDDAKQRWISPSLHLDALTYSHLQSGTGRKRLTWIWTNEVETAVASLTEGGRVSVDDGPWCETTNAWLRIGAPHTIKGSEDSTNIHRWEGLPDNVKFSTVTEKWCASFVPSAPSSISVVHTRASVKTWIGGTGSWENPDGWDPVGVPTAANDVLLIPGSVVTVSNAINIASLEFQGQNNVTSILTFATKWATNRVAGAVKLGEHTVMTHEKNWHWCATTNGMFYSIAVNVNDVYNNKAYTTTPPEIWYTLNLAVGGDMTIAAGAKIDVSQAGYGPKWTPDGYDATLVSGTTGSGSLPVHAGAASCGWNVSGKATAKQKQEFANGSEKSSYGSVRHPVTPGSGNHYANGFSDHNYGFGGGGIVHLMVVGELNLEGEILSRSGTMTVSQSYGTGAGGSVWLEAAAVTGSGTIDVRGGDFGGNKDCAPNSSAGRIAIYQTAAETNPASLTLKAGSAENSVDGWSAANGANGSIYIENAVDYPGRGELIVDYGGRDCYSVTNVSKYTGENRNRRINCLLLDKSSLDGGCTFRKITVRGKGLLTLADKLELTTYALDDTTRGAIVANTFGNLPALGAHYEAGTGFGSINIKSAPPAVKFATLNITGNPTCNYRAYQNGEEVTSTRVESNATVRIVISPAKGYQFVVPPDGWSAGEIAGTAQKDYIIINNPTTITLPEAFPYEPLPISGDYVEVGYIEADGKQYIDTGIAMQDDLAAEMSVEFTKLDASQAMLAAYTSENREHLVYLSRVDNITHFAYGVGASGPTKFAIAQVVANHRYELQSSICGSAANFAADTESASVTTSSSVTPKDTTLYLFALNQSGTAKYFANAKLYSCRIYRNGSIIAYDFVPVQCTTDSVYGLYDRIGQKFYPSKSATAFFGPEAPPPTPKPQVAFSLTPAAHTTFRLFTNNLEVTEVPSKVMTNGTIKVIVIPDDDYEYLTMPEGWSNAPVRLQIQRTFTADTDPYEITLPEPQYYYRERGLLAITGEPEEYQIENEPLYTNGIVFIDGRSQTFVAPSASVDVNLEGTIRRRVTGYRVDSWDGSEWIPGERNDVLAYEHVQAGGATNRLVWIWENEVLVDLTSGIVGDSVSVNGEEWANAVSGWCRVGGTIRLWGGRSDETYYGWSGIPTSGVAYEDANHRILILAATEPTVLSTYEADPPIDLPAGYRQVEYIRSTGEQYLDTGITVQDRIASNLRVEFTDLASSDENGDGPCMLGAYDWITGLHQYLAYLTAPENDSHWRIGLGTQKTITEWTGPGSVKLGSVYRVKSSTDDISASLNVNGLNETNYFYNVAISGTPVSTLYLFARNYNGNPRSMASAKLYSARVYTNLNVMARQYVPCKETATGRFGLYELVNGAFIPSATSVDFLGPDPTSEPQSVMPTKVELTATSWQMRLSGEHSAADVSVVGSETLDGTFTEVTGFSVEPAASDTLVTVPLAPFNGYSQYFFQVLVK